MAKLSKEEVKHVAHLARLAITDEEAEKFADQLGKITDLCGTTKRIRHYKCCTDFTCLTNRECNA